MIVKHDEILASFPTCAGVQITSYYAYLICNHSELDDNIIEICNWKLYCLYEISHGHRTVRVFLCPLLCSFFMET